ncbi:MAG: hypothetical protein ACFB14_00500 [Leptolyngbyaceae cyanobacterium]
MSEKSIVRPITQQIRSITSTLGILTVGLGWWTDTTPAALAQTAHSGCYVQNENGEIYDLGELCSAPSDRTSERTAEPVLQTGDVQVTLRWNTNDDLDLIVVDPAGNIVDFGSPASPSGGQLDVDANGFCQTQSFAPVENIFWPTGSAPDGEYLAYVALAIPCSLEELASANASAANVAYGNLAVPYTLTILIEGATTTYDGVSKPEEFGIDYPFQVGPPVASPPPAEMPEDRLELPGFGLPEL